MGRVANASTLGYAAFALTLWITSMFPAGWFDTAEGALAVWMAIVLGGCVMSVAGILQCINGRVLDGTLFVLFAAYWWVIALAAHAGSGSGAASAGFVGWYYIVWAILAFCFCLAAWRRDVSRMLFTLGLCLSLLALGVAEWMHLDALTVLGGYLGLVAAIVGIYLAAAEIINETHGHVVLPLGEVSDHGLPIPTTLPDRAPHR